MASLVVAIVAWQLDSATQEREQSVNLQTQHYAQAIEAHVQYSIQFADYSLQSFISALKVLPPTAENISTLLSSRGTIFGDNFWITFLDQNGKAIASSKNFGVVNVDYSDRDYYRAQLKHGTGLYVSAPTIGRVSKDRLFFISRRVDDANGNMLGVIVAPLNAQQYGNVFENSRLSHDVSIALVHANGRVIARAPDFERSYNWDMSKSALFEHLALAPSGTFQSSSQIDNRSRIFSYRKLGDLPLIVTVGSTDIGINLLSRRQLVIAGSALLLLLTIMLLMSIFALRSFAKLEEREHRYRALYISSAETERKLGLSEQRLRLIADNLPIVIAYIDRDERYTFTNKKFETVFGKGETVPEVLSPQLYQATKPYLQRAFHGESVYFERQYGTRIHGITYVPDKNDEQQVAGLFVMAEDITERKKQEETMQLAALMYENASEGMMVTDSEGTILSVNPAFTRISGYTDDEIVGEKAYKLTSGKQDIKFFSRMRQSIAHTGHWDGEVWHEHKTGDHYLVSLRFSTVFDVDGMPHRHVALFSDITKKKANEELIWKQANFDTLTGLPNRRMFHDRLQQEMKKAARDSLPMALVFIDLDGFKAVNDTLGHDHGDLLLRQVAERLLQSVRNTDTVARLGGDEFTVILSELKESNDVVRIAQEILANMAKPFQLGLETADISASIGITMYPDDGMNAETLIKNADQAMYTAKQQGRNRFNYFAPFMQEASQIRIELLNELRSALKNNELRLLFQPIHDLKTGEITMAEALIRWQHPQRGLLTPAEFIGVAEQTGVIADIGEWVFQEAALLAKRLQLMTDNKFQICVNKSAWQFRHEAVSVDHWLTLLQEHRLSPRSIIIEITENLLLDANREVVNRLQLLQDAHVQVSLDDFGVGYSSLNFLKRFKIDFLKLDNSFADNLPCCEAIIAMAHHLGIKVVAEQVETALQLANLELAGCDFAQGYLFSAPISAEKLEQLLITQ
jgi:diguanylate cyclase (GGDEF)-like protein/PAS domain S-box-containing protein